MPFSDGRHIPIVLHFATALKPRRVLDVGIGIGAYGLLLRAYLDIAEQRVTKDVWKTQIDGVEVFAGYRNPVWEYAYDTVIVDDARNVLARCTPYDLVLFGDVLEHFERSEARAMVQSALLHSSAVIATTPHVEMVQGTWGGNAAEAHLSLLNATDFPNLVAKKTAPDTTCYVCSRDPVSIERLKDAAALCPTYRIDKVAHWKRRIARRISRMTGAPPRPTDR
jgi:hypothetical protein